MAVVEDWRACEWRRTDGNSRPEYLKKYEQSHNSEVQTPSTHLWTVQEGSPPLSPHPRPATSPHHLPSPPCHSTKLKKQPCLLKRTKGIKTLASGTLTSQMSRRLPPSDLCRLGD